jgi:hypothetical protein
VRLRRRQQHRLAALLQDLPHRLLRLLLLRLMLRLRLRLPDLVQHYLSPRFLGLLPLLQLRRCLPLRQLRQKLHSPLLPLLLQLQDLHRLLLPLLRLHRQQMLLLLPAQQLLQLRRRDLHRLLLLLQLPMLLH